MEKTLYYIKMTWKSILFVRREMFGKKKREKKSEKKKNIR